MAYDEDLAQRLRLLTGAEEGVSEKSMFGGLAFLINGNMAVAACGLGGIMVRVDPADSDAFTSEPGASRMVMRGKEMDGWLRVEEDAVADDAVLETWAGRGVAYAGSLPPKKK